ncbi:MAG: single-stranded-DNA-specific exonuclease RecJ [Ruminococcus sp.]|nr:single-stranded-DNA-specific exonuclease RecJ [Ruminococcus sp.]
MKYWTINNPDKKIIHSFMTDYDITPLTAVVLASKGYDTTESVMESLEMRELSDPFLIKDMNKAVETINNAVDNGERICIYGDYDCDGVMSTVIMYSYLLENGADVIYYIPERSEGYGLNKGAIDKISAEGVGLIVTVDNGISAINEAEYIYSLGMKLVVTDHHQQGEKLPRAEAVVDTHRHDCESPFKHMCGAGIALKVISALGGGDCTFALEQFGDLVAIATIADIVPIIDENRFLVSYGLQLMENTDRPSLIALKKVCGLDKKTITSHSVGFGIAPRINASGRFGSPKTAVELFLCDEYDKAEKIAEELDRLNTERKNTEREITEEIYAMINKNPDIMRERVIFLCGKDWHHGVIGIVASKIVEHFGKPCFIASECNGETRGSARSFGKFSVFDTLSYASETLEKFGGHLGAGGFTIKNGMTEDFHAMIEKYALENHKIMPVYTVSADTAVAMSELSVDNVKGLEVLEPHGFGNEKPLFFIGHVHIDEIISLSNGKHTKLRISSQNLHMEALAFFTEPSALCVKVNELCDMMVSLGVNEFRGQKSVNIIVEDIRPHGFMQKKYISAQNAFEAFMRNEELPDNYYNAMLPDRDESVKVYKNISANGIKLDSLYMKLHEEMNYCKFLVATEAFRQLGFIEFSSSDLSVRKISSDEKKDLFSAPVFIALKEKIKA